MCIRDRAYCDWSIGCRLDAWNKKEKIITCWGNPDILPKIIFISCSGFKFFFNTIYPYIPKCHKYSIIIGDHDVTIPSNKDLRYPSDYTMSVNMWNEIVENPQIIHIYCTHLTIPATDKYSAIPVGFNPQEHPNHNIDHLLNVNINLDLSLIHI